VVLATAVFVAVSLPFCLSLSESKGRFTFGDVGTLAYRHVMGFEDETLPPTAIARPVATPHILEYTGILQLGTYHAWADASHNFKGAPFQFNLRRQINRTHVVLRDYFNVYVEKLGGLDFGLLVLIFWSGARLFAKRFWRHVVLWLPALAGLAFYWTMRVEDRFLAGFTVALFAACIACIRMTDLRDSAKLTGVVTLAVSSLLFAQAGVEAGHEAIKLLGHAQHQDWQVANTLHQMGVCSGSENRIGNSFGRRFKFLGSGSRTTRRSVGLAGVHAGEGACDPRCSQHRHGDGLAKSGRHGLLRDLVAGK
jgi:hypothetical protein